MSDFPVHLPPEAADSIPRSAKTRLMTAKQRGEATLLFVRLLFAGEDQAKAFVLSGLAAETTWTTEQGLRNSAADYANRPEIQDELEKMRERVRKVTETQLVYEQSHAMQEADMAFRMGLAKADPKAMVQAVFLKAKLRGLLVEDRKNERTPLKDLSSEELDGLIRELKNDVVTLEGVSSRIADHPAEEPNGG